MFTQYKTLERLKVEGHGMELYQRERIGIKSIEMKKALEKTGNSILNRKAGIKFLFIRPRKNLSRKIGKLIYYY